MRRDQIEKLDPETRNEALYPGLEGILTGKIHLPPYIEVDILENSAMAFLNLQSVHASPEIPPRVLAGLGKALPLASNIMLQDLHGFDQSQKYPPHLLAAIRQANTVSPDGDYFDSAENFDAKFNIGDIFLLKRKGFTPKDFERMFDISITRKGTASNAEFGVETGVYYLSGFDKAFYLVGSENKIDASRAQSTVLNRHSIQLERNPVKKPSLFTHVHPLLRGFRPSPGDFSNASDNERANPGSRYFVGSFQRNLALKIELAFIEYGSAETIPTDNLNRDIISTPQFTDIFNTQTNS